MKKMNKWKSYGVVIGVMLFLLASTALYFSARNLMQMIPKEDYADQGIHRFYPYQVLPTPVKNTSASSRDRRMNPTKTVYMVYYRADDGSGYQWSEQAVSREQGQQMVGDRQPVERRVLDIPTKNEYITIDPEQTIESYTTGLGKKYRMILMFSVGYLLIYVVVWSIILVRRKRADIR